jgi:NADPH2:quinone reductase
MMSLNYEVASDEALQANTADLFEMVGSGAVKIEVNQTFALADAAKSHQDLEG